MQANSLVAIETHPIQYHAPVYRALQQVFDVPITVIYGSDFSVKGYRDREFGASFAWDTDLLTGYNSVFLSNSEIGGANSVEEVTTTGLRKFLRELQPRAILLLGYSPRFFQQAILQAWTIRCPLLFRAETTDHASPRTRLKGWIRDSLLRLFYRRCDKLLFVGERSRRHFLRLGCLENKLIFSPYCVDLSAFQPSEADRELLRTSTRDRLDVTAGQMILLFSGKLSRRKGVDILVRAVQQLPPDLRHRVVVVFLGSGELQPDLELLARIGPAVQLRFLGFQNQKALSAYYHAADLLVLPSVHSETWGLVVNEALHHGVPALVSDNVGCGPDLVVPGSTGEVFAANSVDSLADAIIRSLPLTDSATVRSKCRSLVSNYTVEKAAEGIALAHREVVRSGPGALAIPTHE